MFHAHYIPCAMGPMAVMFLEITGICQEFLTKLFPLVAALRINSSEQKSITEWSITEDERPIVGRSNRIRL